MVGQVNDTKKTGETAAVQRPTLQGLKPPILLAAYLIIVLLPLILALAQGKEPRSFYRELSSGLVMVGYAMMLVQFVLSGRLRQISGRVGIDITMRFHQLVAYAILAFVVVHPFLYASPNLWANPEAAWRMLSGMFSSSGLRTGVVAWFILPVLILMGVFRDRLPLSYEVWRFSHGAGALVLALLGTHHTVGVGTYSGEPVLSAFWILLTAVAVGALLYVYVAKPLLKSQRPWRVVGNKQAAERTWAVTLEPESRDVPTYLAGQFAWVSFGRKPYSLVEHPFSISSAPGDGRRVGFLIKEAGDFTRTVGGIPVGTTAYFDGPHGAFVLPEDLSSQEPLVFIAGGVGIAPILGMLRDLDHAGHRGPLRLIYGNRVAEQIVARDELEGMADRLDLRTSYVLSEPPADWSGLTGMISQETIAQGLEGVDPATAWVYLCGPGPMMDVTERALADLGTPPRRIVAERFKYD